MKRQKKIQAIEESLEQLEMSKQELVVLIKKILEAEISISQNEIEQQVESGVEGDEIEQNKQELSEIELLQEQEITEIVNNPEILEKLLSLENINKIDERLRFAKNLHNVKKLKVELELKKIKEILELQGALKLKNYGSVETRKGTKHLQLKKLVSINNYIEQKIEQKQELEEEQELEGRNSSNVKRRVGSFLSRLSARKNSSSKLIAKLGDTDFDPTNDKENKAKQQNDDNEKLIKELQTKKKNTQEIQSENISQTNDIDSKIAATEQKASNIKEDISKAESGLAEKESNAVDEQKNLAKDQQEGLETEGQQQEGEVEVSEDKDVKATDSKAVSKKESIKTKSSLMKLDAIADRQALMESKEMSSVRDAIKNMGKDLKAAEQNKDLLKELKEQKMRDNLLQK